MKKVTQVYFSATENTKKSVNAMAEALSHEKSDVIDVTSYSCDSISKTFTNEDFVIFGMPVYGGRCPKIAMQRLAGIKGNETACIVVVTYGNRDYDDALLELSDFAKAQGFVVKGAAALVGKHTFGEIQMHRPDDTDLKADREFALKAEKNTNDTIEFKGNHPYKDGGNGGKFRPSTTDDCVKCGLCVSKCSAGAISKDCVTISDSCISCFRCIDVCPKGAKKMISEQYDAFAVDFSQKLSARRENEYYL